MDKIFLMHHLKTCGQHLVYCIEDLKKLDNQERERAEKLFHKINLLLFEIKLTRRDLLEIGLKINKKHDMPWFAEINRRINLMRKKFGIKEGGKS